MVTLKRIKVTIRAEYVDITETSLQRKNKELVKEIDELRVRNEELQTQLDVLTRFVSHLPNLPDLCRKNIPKSPSKADAIPSSAPIEDYLQPSQEQEGPLFSEETIHHDEPESEGGFGGDMDMFDSLYEGPELPSPAKSIPESKATPEITERALFQMQRTM
jgi:hypothetical protein